ncbi:MAG TPA: hypothetical protein VHE78_18290 [Gemmatimonadaceae bacterium]|nr:hypothetical protein [Gemmatimonadaceae bacterium]
MSPKPDPAKVAQQLRNAAISMKPAELGLAPTTALPHVWGLLMETGHPEAVASLAVFAEGTTSLYFSTGGGVIGAGQHERVRSAARAFLASAEENLARLSSAASAPLPRPGRVRFYAQTFDGLLSAEADEQELGLGRHPLSVLFHAGQAVITEVRHNVSAGAIAQAGLDASPIIGADQHAETKRHIESLASGIDTLRRLATQRTAYRAPGGQDAVPPATQEALAAASQELDKEGMTVLGDRMELQADGTAVGPGRWFIDETATICGRFSATVSKTKGTVTPLMMLFSEASSGEFFLTGRGGAGVALAKPPKLFREYVAWSDGLGRALDRHKAATAAATQTGTLRRVDALDDALDLLARLRKSGSDWRSLQDPDVLLELDVRAVLGKRYDELGPQVIRALTRGRR